MPLVTCIVDTDGTGDYLSLNAAAVANFGATSADLVTNDEWVECDCQCTSGSADTTKVTIDGLTTDATHNVKIWCDPASGYRHSGIWNSSAYRLEVTDAVARCIIISNNNTALHNLQIKATATGSFISYNLFLGTQNNITIDSCIIAWDISASTASRHDGIYVDNASGVIGWVIKNNIIYGGIGTPNVSGIFVNGDASTDISLYQNTIYGCDSGFRDYPNACELLYKNNVAYNCTDDFNTYQALAGSTNNMSEDAAESNMANHIVTTQAAIDIWTDAANGDFSVKDINSDLYGAGADLSTEMDAVDIAGTTRPQGTAWDIGAFEYVSSGGTTISAECSDGLSLSDTSSRTATLLAACADGLAMADGPGSNANLVAQLVDGLVAGDVPSKSIIFRPKVTDGISLSDSVTSAVAIIAQAADGITTSDQASAIATLLASVADSVRTSDATNATAQFQAQTGDGVVFSDSTNWGAILQAIAADGITLSDNATGALSLVAQAADGIMLSDSSTATANFVVECADGVQFADTVAAIMQFVVSVSDGVALSDTAVSITAGGGVLVTFKTKEMRFSFEVKPQ